ncbi:hypothetical protein TNCV_2033571 [Trichonephila clavipes]|nr:hypothetical protein TNCV_2033571 [Trichonephila clavipes]
MIPDANSRIFPQRLIHTYRTLELDGQVDMIDEDSIGIIILLLVEGTSLDTGILGIGGWDSDIADVEGNRCA